MKPGGQRLKGAVFERKISNLLKHIWPNARRGIQYRDGGKEASDITGTPYHIECSKGQESIWAKWRQANHDCSKPVEFQGVYEKNTSNPVVIKQRDHEKPVVMISLLEWIRLQASHYITDLEKLRLLEEQYKKEFGNL